ncbi:MAG: DnaJ domain-containing protein [Acidobacteria bacterium]|nr:DnaJ domain-containing protein [Acidobacteriota bacterium]
MPEEQFVDYYELMQISPNAELGTIQRVFRMLASRYHPDNPRTGDIDRFLLLTKAYRILSNAEAKADYDVEYLAKRLQPLGVFGLKEFELGIDGEANRRMGVLCLLYNRRRSNPDRPGVSVLELETMMTFPREHLMFTLWYLKDKNLALQDESSDIVITGLGVDHVEANLPSNKILYKMLKAAENGRSQTEESISWSTLGEFADSDAQ